MEKDVDFLISFFNKYSDSFEKKDELGEQDAAPSGDSGGGGSGSKNTVSKWADVVGGPARGVANPVARQKWSDAIGGPNRGVANQLT